MGLFDIIGDFIAYIFCIDTTQKSRAYEAKTEYGREESEEEKCDQSWYDNKREYHLDFGAFNNTEYIHGYTNQQRQNFRHYWRLLEPCTPYPKTYRFYPSLEGL
jgi:hypothetical protein